MPKHEPEHWEPGEIDLVVAAAEPDVVAEPCRYFWRVGHAAHPRQRGDVVQRPPFVRLETESVAETGRDQPRPKDMFHRLAQAEVAGQGESGDDLRQLHAGVAASTVHAQSVA